MMILAIMMILALLLFFNHFLLTGDGEAYCFISNPEAVLYFFVSPIALIMLFNTFSLVHTVLNIVKTRKVRLSYQIWIYQIFV